MSQNQKPGYYAVIPADVRYDDRISPNAKLLYGEISALLNHEGYCFASNAYFERLYQITERTVRRLISQLQDCGYITVQLDRAADGTVSHRKIRLATSAPDGQPEDKNVPTPGQSFPEGEDKNVRYNNLSITNIEKKNKKEKSGSHTLDDGQMDQLVMQNVGTLGDCNGWSRDEKNTVYLLVKEFYGDRECSGKPPAHTARGVGGLFRKLAPGGRCTFAEASDMLLTAIERGWTSVYPKDSRIPAAPVPQRNADLGEEWA